MEKPSSGRKWDNISASWAPILSFEPHLILAGQPWGGGASRFQCGLQHSHVHRGHASVFRGQRFDSEQRCAQTRGPLCTDRELVSFGILSLWKAALGRANLFSRGCWGRRGLPRPPLLSLLWPACYHLYRTTVFFAHTGVLIILYLFFVIAES